MSVTLINELRTVASISAAAVAPGVCVPGVVSSPQNRQQNLQNLSHPNLLLKVLRSQRWNKLASFALARLILHRTSLLSPKLRLFIDRCRDFGAGPR